MKIRECVKQFHAAMGQTDRTAPGFPSEEVIRLRVRLITEEYLEFMEAVYGREGDQSVAAMMAEFDEATKDVHTMIDLAALADATIDLDYVVEGTRLAFGIDGEPLLAAVHAANMAKVGGARRADGKFLKPEGWTPPDITGELKKQGWTP